MNLNRMGLTLKHNATHILTGVAVAGVIGTVIMAVKATPRVYEAIVAHEEYEGRNLEEGQHYRADWKEKVAIGWKPYLPAVILGAATVSCIIAINTIGTRRNAAIAAGAVVASQTLQEYRKAVVEKIGEEQELRLRDAVNEKVVQATPPDAKEIVVETNGKVMCYDTWSSRYFYSTKQDIENARNNVNLRVINDMYAPQNDFYSELGLARISMGDEYGWNTDVPMSIYFTSILSAEDVPVLAIDYHNLPIANYNKFW